LHYPRLPHRIKQAYERDANLKNLLLDPFFRDIIAKTQSNWRYAICTAVEHGIATPAFSASLAYFDSYRQERLPSNLLRRNAFFGAHTFDVSTNQPVSFSSRVVCLAPWL
jgi:6-phosphogluconate dehydrogenase